MRFFKKVFCETPITWKLILIYSIATGISIRILNCIPFLETVVLLSKGEVDSKKIRVEFSLEDMDMSEFQGGATYPQLKEYVLEHTGLKVSNLYISQIKRKCGIEIGKKCYDYYAHPGLYELTSAPWYTSILLHGVVTAVVFVICAIIKVIIKLRKQK